MSVWLKAHAKALVPAVATLVGVVALWAITGELNQDELYAAGVGVAVAAGVYGVPNTARRTRVEIVGKGPQRRGKIGPKR